MTYGHLRADCLYTGISSGPNDRYRVWESLYLYLFFYLLPLRRYKAKRVKPRSFQERVGHFEPRFQGERVVPWGIFFAFYKTKYILLSDSANCTVLRAVVLTHYRRVTEIRTDRRTDRQTDGIAIASTAHAMRALPRAVKVN